MIEGSVDFSKGSVDLVVVARWTTGAGGGDEGSERSEQSDAELDEQDANLESDGRHAIASARAYALNQGLGAQLGQIVAELAEAVVAVGEVVTCQDARMQLAGSPVTSEGGGMQQRLQHTDQPVVVELQAGKTSLPNNGRLS